MILEEVGGGKRKLFCTYFKYVLEKNIDFLMHLKGIMLFFNNIIRSSNKV